MKKLFENWKRYLNESGTYKRVMQQTADGRMVGKNVYVPPPNDPYDPPEKEQSEPWSHTIPGIRNKIEDNRNLLEIYPRNVKENSNLARWSQVYPGDHIKAAENIMDLRLRSVIEGHKESMKYVQEKVKELQKAYVNNDSVQIRVLEDTINRETKRTRNMTSRFASKHIKDIRFVLSMASNIKAYVDEEVERDAKEQGFEGAEDFYKKAGEEGKAHVEKFQAANEKEHLPRIKELNQELNEIIKLLGIE